MTYERRDFLFSNPAPLMNSTLVPIPGSVTACLGLLTFGLPFSGLGVPEVIERGPHHLRVRDGNSQYEQVETGLHRWHAQQKTWVVTDPTIELFQDGAIVRNLQYGVIFAPSLADPAALDIQLPSGERMVGQIMGLSYTLGNRSVLVDEIRPCAGEVINKNELIFRSAFANTDMDVLFRAERGKLSQSVVIKTQLPHPRNFGFAEAEADLVHVELLTEWTTLPSVQKETQVLEGAAKGQNALTHERIRIAGSMEFLRGQAFTLGEGAPVDVASSLETIENRTFLLEKIPWKALAPQLKKLPAIDARVGTARANGGLAKTTRILPAKRTSKTKVKPIQMAQAPVQLAQGFLWDWELATTISKQIWLPNVTYYLSGNCTVQTNEFWGGTVLKYAPTNFAKLTITGPVSVHAERYKPITLTARDDHTIGDSIGTNAISGTYADQMLYFNNFGFNSDLSHFRIRFANVGIYYFGGSGHIFRHGSIVKCLKAIWLSDAECHLRDVMVNDCGTIFQTISGFPIVHGENVTLYKSINANNLAATFIYLTNAVLADVWFSGSPPYYVGANNFTYGLGSDVFQEVGGGKMYLKSTATARNAGTTNINPNLLAALRERTTSAPLILSNKVLLDTVLTRAVQRDTDAIDCGAHYDPIDYCISSLAVSNATLVVTNGVAFATFGYNGIYLERNGKLISAGHPLRPNHFTRAYAVQEQPTNWLETPPYQGRSLFTFWTNEPPTIDLRWTSFELPAGGGYHIYSDYGAFGVITNFSMRDCQTLGGQLYFWDEQALNRFYFTNNLFEYTDIWLWDAKAAQFYNNTFVGVTGFLSQSVSNQNWRFDDNLVDSSPFINSSPWMIHSNNAFYNSADFYSSYPTNTSELVLTSLNYDQGRLGRHYQRTNSSLLNAGSLTNAALRGMYHFTILTNETKELTNHLDIGFHSVALTTNWSSVLLQDNDSDSLADFFEDRNGNGIFDSSEGETDWTTYNSLFGIGTGPGLVVFTPLKP
jgi:hypothetical protein